MSTQTDQPDLKRQTISSLQALRALAALLVVFSHIRHKHLQNSEPVAQFMSGYDFGPYGVDIFFVISGFIIAYIGPPGFHTLADIARFAKRRVVRIFPLYWLVTLVAFTAWLYNPQIVNSSAPHLTRIWESFVLWPTDGRYLYQTGWTLSYEIYFYLLFALTMLAGPLQRIILPVFLAASIALGVYLTPNKDSPVFHMVTGHYLIEFLAGYLFCILFRNNFQNFPRAGLAFLGLGTCLILAKSVFGGPVLEGIYYWGAPAILIVFGGLMIENIIKWPKHIIAMGDASYALYLTHSLVLAPLAIIWYKLLPASLTSNVLFMLVALAATLITAHLCHLIFEKPVTRLLYVHFTPKRDQQENAAAALKTDQSSLAR